MLMSRIKRQRKSFLALFLIALFALSVNATRGAAIPPVAPSLKPTGIRLEYLGQDAFGYSYRVYVKVKNEGGPPLCQRSCLISMIAAVMAP